MRKILITLLILIALMGICYAQTKSISPDGGNVVTKDKDGNVTVTGDLTVTGDISGIHADGKLIRVTDSVYTMTSTNWQIVDDWDWEVCSPHNMTVDSVNNNIECDTGYDGHYMVTGFITLSVGANSQNIYVGIGKNGSDPATHAQSMVQTKTAGEISNLAFVNMPSLVAGDSLSVYIKNADGGQNITVGRSNFIFYLLHQD